MDMYVAWLHETVYTDGPGARASVAVQGCSVRCAGCQVPQTWKHRTGTLTTPQQVAQKLLSTGLPVTILGGEPFDQPQALQELVAILKHHGREVMVYSGNTLEALVERGDPAVQAVLNQIDILVDGPYMRDLDHGRLAYRGSSNQRPIDMVAWRSTGEITLLPWDESDELTILPDGTIIGPEDVMREFELAMGQAGSSARHCGQAPTEKAST